MTSTHITQFPANCTQREITGAGAVSSLAPAPGTVSHPAGAATAHDITARRGLGEMAHHFEEMNAETWAQRAMRLLCWIVAATLFGALLLFVFFLAGKAGSNIALAFVQAGF